MSAITKDHALTICKKLKAVKESAKGAAHIDYSVYYGGVYLGSFGVRNGSNRSLPHNHIPDNLNIPYRLAWELGSCTKYLEDYVACMREKGMLPSEESPVDEAKALPESRPWEIDWVARQEAESTAEQAEEAATAEDGEEPPRT